MGRSENGARCADGTKLSLGIAVVGLRGSGRGKNRLGSSRSGKLALSTTREQASFPLLPNMARGKSREMNTQN